MNLRLYQQLLLLLLSSSLFLSPNAVSAQTSATNTVESSIFKAEQALQTAKSAHAPTLASDVYQIAQDAYQQALAWQAKRKTKEVARYTAICIRYAELSSSQAQYLQLKNAIEAKVSENAALRRNLLLGKSLEVQ